MQVKVPQQLLTYEDKVIGPLTFKQFIYIGVGSAASVTMILTFPPSGKIVAFILSIPVMFVFGSLAFLKLQGRSSEIMARAIITFFLVPRKRIWQKELEIESAEVDSTSKPKAAVVPKKNVYEIRSALEKLAVVVDTSGSGHEVVLGEASLTSRVIRPAHEVAKAPEPSDVTSDANRHAALEVAISEVAGKTIRPIHQAAIGDRPVDKLTAKPAKRYKYKYKNVEVNSKSNEVELQAMIYQYKATHSKKKAQVLRHGQQAQTARPLEANFVEQIPEEAING